jgi:hypothetical protein
MAAPAVPAGLGCGEPARLRPACLRLEPARPVLKTALRAYVSSMLRGWLVCAGQGGLLLKHV